MPRSADARRGAGATPYAELGWRRLGRLIALTGGGRGSPLPIDTA